MSTRRTTMRQGLTIFLIIMALLYIIWGFYTLNQNPKRRIRINNTSNFLLSFVLSMVSLIQWMTLSNELFWVDSLWIMLLHVGIFALLCLKQFHTYVNARLFHSLQDVVIVIDQKGNIQAVNKAFTKLLGYEEDELINLPISQIALDITSDVLLTQTIIPLFLMKSKQGDEIPFHLTITAHGHKQGYYLLAKDIRLIQHLQIEVESRKLAEQHFQNSEALFRLVVKMLPHAIIMTRVEDDVILYVNPRASSLFHTTTEEMIGSHAHLYYVDWTNRSELKKEILATKNAILEREFLFRRKDDETFIGQFSVQQAVYQDEAVLLFAIGDVTMQRSLEKAVAQSEQLLRRLMDAIPDFIVVSDLCGNISYVNQAVSELLADNVKHFHDFMWLDQAEVKNHLERSYKEIHRFEVTCVNKKQVNCVLGIHANVIFDTSQKPFSVIYVMRDITTRKEIELQLLQTKQEIEMMNNKLLEANTKLTEQTIRDSLTGLFNLKHINSIITREMNLCKRNDKAKLSVMMLDIDHFKSVNDDYGHLFGDEVLIFVARTIESCLRNTDYAGRYGGEEFMVVLPNTSLEQACRVAQRIREAVSDTVFSKMNRNITVSIGVAQWENKDNEVRDLIRRADTLLYKAKSNGRNRLEFEE